MRLDAIFVTDIHLRDHYLSESPLLGLTIFLLATLLLEEEHLLCYVMSEGELRIIVRRTYRSIAQSIVLRYQSTFHGTLALPGDRP